MFTMRACHALKVLLGDGKLGKQWWVEGFGTVNADYRFGPVGSSPECQALCDSDPTCTGYMTADITSATPKCGLLGPASAGVEVPAPPSPQRVTVKQGFLVQRFSGSPRESRTLRGTPFAYPFRCKGVPDE